MKNLSGKIVLVTGGASGLGKAIVERFVAEGCKVVLADVNAEAGPAVARSLAAPFIRADVADPAHVEAAVQFVVTTFGRLDVIVNNAGVESVQAPTHECDESSARNADSGGRGGGRRIPGERRCAFHQWSDPANRRRLYGTMR
jgi:NAD(P)-dependent dehydrogenase (short-subunit alcohol dehydrogenase family)